jgi:hypothetical protein
MEKSRPIVKSGLLKNVNLSLPLFYYNSAMKRIIRRTVTVVTDETWSVVADEYEVESEGETLHNPALIETKVAHEDKSYRGGDEASEAREESPNSIQEEVKQP